MCVQDREKAMGVYANALAQWNREDIKAYTYMPHNQLLARKQLVSKAKRSSLENVKTVHEWTWLRSRWICHWSSYVPSLFQVELLQKKSGALSQSSHNPAFVFKTSVLVSLGRYTIPWNIIGYLLAFTSVCTIMFEIPWIVFAPSIVTLRRNGCMQCTIV